jgi:hypothetical protein
MNLADATTLHNAIPDSSYNGDGTFDIPCSTNVQIEFVFNPVTYLILTKDLLDPVQTGGCLSNIIGIGKSALWIVGSPFLRNVSLEIYY